MISVLTAVALSLFAVSCTKENGDPTPAPTPTPTPGVEKHDAYLCLYVYDKQLSLLDVSVEFKDASGNEQKLSIDKLSKRAVDKKYDMVDEFTAFGESVNLDNVSCYTYSEKGVTEWTGEFKAVFSTKSGAKYGDDVVEDYFGAVATYSVYPDGDVIKGSCKGLYVGQAQSSEKNVGLICSNFSNRCKIEFDFSR